MLMKNEPFDEKLHSTLNIPFAYFRRDEYPYHKYPFSRSYGRQAEIKIQWLRDERIAKY